MCMQDSNNKAVIIAKDELQLAKITYNYPFLQKKFTIYEKFYYKKITKYHINANIVLQIQQGCNNLKLRSNQDYFKQKTYLIYLLLVLLNLDYQYSYIEICNHYIMYDVLHIFL